MFRFAKSRNYFDGIVSLYYPLVLTKDTGLRDQFLYNKYQSGVDALYEKLKYCNDSTIHEALDKFTNNFVCDNRTRFNELYSEYRHECGF